MRKESIQIRRVFLYLFHPTVMFTSTWRPYPTSCGGTTATATSWPITKSRSCLRRWSSWATWCWVWMQSGRNVDGHPHMTEAPVSVSVFVCVCVLYLVNVPSSSFSKYLIELLWHVLNISHFQNCTWLLMILRSCLNLRNDVWPDISATNTTASTAASLTGSASPLTSALAPASRQLWLYTIQLFTLNI